MPPIGSRSTHYRAIRRIRLENENMLRKMKKIRASQELQSSRISPAAVAHAAPESPQPNVNQDELLQVIFGMATKHGLTKSCMPDMLELTRLLIGSNGKTPECLESAYKLRKAMENQRKLHSNTSEEVIFHHYCENCEKLFEDSRSECAFCHQPRFDSDGKPRAVFMEMNPGTQIQDFFRDKHFVEGIKYRFSRPSNENICDVYDGKLYKSLFEDNGFLSCENNLSLIWHTDGVSIFKSSSMQAWPVQSTICELPPNRRFSKEYVVIHGLWFGRHKPTMHAFLQPMIATMNKLRDKGIEVKPYGEDSVVTSRVCSLACTMDLPAAAAVKELHQWNGSYGCTMCEEPGETVSTGKRGGSCRAYKYPKEEPVLRTTERLLCQAGENLETDKVTNGVKGFSALFDLHGFDVGGSVLIDYLHGVCLGVMKRMFSCWFDKKGEDFYIGHSTNIINQRLLAIKVPRQITRPPRRIEERLHYKASEYRNWLLYYGLHVLKGVLPDEYYIHFGMLVRAIHILLSRSITSEELTEARDLLRKWYYLVEGYYGADQCTINVHNVGIHLVQCVELCGPMWAFSCFFFESMCGQMARMVKGTQQVQKQILSGIRTRQFLKRTTEDAENKSVRWMMRRDRRKLIPVAGGFCRVGKYKRWRRFKQQVKAVKNMNRTLSASKGMEYYKVEKGSAVFHTQRNLKRRADHFVVYKQDQSLKCGVIHIFLHLQGFLEEAHFMLVKPLTVSPSKLMSTIPAQMEKDHMVYADALSANYMHCSSNRDEQLLEAVPMDNIIEPFIFLPNNEYGGECVIMPTVLEHD